MSAVVLTGGSPDLQQNLRDAAGPADVAMLAGLPADPAELFAQLDGAPTPDVVVLDAVAERQPPALALAGRLAQQCPGISVVLVSDRPADVGIPAMRAGVRDVLAADAPVAELREALDRAVAGALRQVAPTAISSGPTGKVISVLSPKGGVGKTTVATNLAVGLAQTAPHSTVLVDLDVQFGDVATALNLDPQYTLPDTVNGPASTDAMVLKTFLTQHETGLYAICGSDSPAAADAVSVDAVSDLLTMLATEFRYVVVDTAPGLVEHTLAVLDHTTDPILLTSMDVAGVRGLRKELETLDALGMFSDNRRVVLNFAGRGGLTVDDVEATIRSKVDLVLPRSKAAPASVDLGIPLLQSGARDPMTKKLTELVERFAPLPEKPGARRRHGRHRAA